MTTGVKTGTGARGARPGFTALTPYLMAPDIEPVIAFAKTVFGAQETMRTRGGAGGIHCELRIGDSMVMCGGGDGAFNPVIAPRLTGLHVYVDDVDLVYARALAAGGEALGAPEDRPYGERAGFVRDRAGNHWYIATPRGAAPSRAVTPHLYVQHTAVKGAPEFLAFAQAAFGALEEVRHDGSDGMVLHAVLSLNGAALEVGEGPAAAFSAPAAFYLYVPDCDAVYARAVAAGATSLHQPADQAHGDRMGALQDAWGNEWFIATHQAAADSRPRS